MAFEIRAFPCGHDVGCLHPFQFYQNGCENCPFFDMGGDEERVKDATTSNFTGYGRFLARVTNRVAAYSLLLFVGPCDSQTTL